MSKSGNRLVDVLPRAGLVTTEPFLGAIRHDASFFKNLQIDQVIAGGYMEAYGERYERRARLDEELATMMDVASKEAVRACLHPFANMATGTGTGTATTAAAVEDSEMTDLATIDNNNHLLRLLGYEISDQLPAAPTTPGEASEQDANAIDDGHFFHYMANIKKELPWAEGLTTSLFNTLFCNVLEARVAWNANPRPPFDQAEHSRTAKATQRLLDAEPEMWATIEGLTSLPAR